MRELPMEFDNRRDEDEFQMTEDRTSGAKFLPTLFLCGLCSIACSVLTSFFMASSERKAEVLEVVGVHGRIERKVNPTDAAVLEIKAAQEKQSAVINDYANRLSSVESALQASSETHESATEKLASRLTVLERFTSDLSLKVEDNKKRVVVAQAVAVKKAAEPQPPKLNVSIKSIRNINGSYWVSLKTPTETSPLLTLQDQWRGVKVVDVDYQQGLVVVSNNGVTERVSI